ncbi:hypothetical protein OE88DRAFT_1218567 [Heliocybe sulcata]|uniref:Fungal-type protein kinase domain-containing protein n=1 Tax=Heliocybe sulcata TaxID=5364 RepID=A0A5C3MKD9_9AGAM|nr:hypothetical protein OE88DRAFT_1218567 [Heliocybe sulcata]
MSALRAQCDIVKIIHDTLVEAYDRAAVRHRDLRTSAQNSLFVARESGGAHGTLTAWDLSLRGRTRTWQFVSYQLLINPSKTHTLQDDLQSSFWTLLYTALKFIPSSLSGMRLANMLKTVFDESRWDDGRRSYVGGNEKLKIIMYGTYIKPNSIAGTPPITFRDPETPLNNLVQALFALHHDWDIYSNPMNNERYRLAAKPEAEKLLNSEANIKLFEYAYSDPEWSHKIPDSREGLFPAMDVAAAPNALAQKRASSEGRLSTSPSPATPLALARGWRCSMSK